MEKRSKSSDREAFDLIEEMLELMESRGLIELEMEHQGLRIRLKKASVGSESSVEALTQTQAAATGHPTQTAPIAKTADDKKTAVKSPMVGTFYRAPAPDAPPFVEVGQKITVGQVVCIIEAMKLMNEIKSEVAGRIVEILVQNGDPIEFGQPLFIVEPPA